MKVNYVNGEWHIRDKYVIVNEKVNEEDENKYIIYDLKEQNESISLELTNPLLGFSDFERALKWCFEN